MDIIYLQKDLSTDNIDALGQEYAYTLMPNGKSFYYIDDSGKLMYTKDFRDLKTDPKKIESDEDVANFVVTSDQSAVYYVDIDGTLWVVRGSSDPEEIDKDVDSGYLTLANDDKGVYYFTDFVYDDVNYTSDGTLNFVENKKKADPDSIAKNVYSFQVSDFGTVYYVYDHEDADTYQQMGEAFVGFDNKKFKSVTEEALFW
jgi:hypothetical protein